MDPREAARLEEHYRRWLRPDWRRFVRHDWERFVHPAQHAAMREDFAIRDRAFETPLARRLRKQNEAREGEQREIDWEAECAERKHRADLAWERFKAAFLRGDLAPHRKANFNPNQPRVPKGRGTESGRWAGPGIGHNQGPPLEKPPAIPKQPPAATKERTAIAKQVARWLARAGAAVASRTPIGLAAVTAAAGATWLYDQYSAHIEAYQDAPKTLEELQSAAAVPRAGYDTHHIVEKTSAAQYGFDKASIDGPDNLVLIPRMKHWEIKWLVRYAERGLRGAFAARLSSR
jgi:hypothetical protein